MTPFRAGLIWHYKQFNKEGELADLEDEAQKAKTGEVQFHGDVE